MDCELLNCVFCCGWGKLCCSELTFCLLLRSSGRNRPDDGGSGAARSSAGVDHHCGSLVRSSTAFDCGRLPHLFEALDGCAARRRRQTHPQRRRSVQVLCKQNVRPEAHFRPFLSPSISTIATTPPRPTDARACICRCTRMHTQMHAQVEAHGLAHSNETEPCL